MALPKSFPDADKLETARNRWKMADAADTNQAQRERDDLAFYAGDQWPADLKLARQGQQPANGMPAVPARPTLVINKVREPVRQVQNEIRDLDIGIELTPADDFGDLGITPDDTEVALREGLLRRVVRDNQAQEAWNWAGDRAASSRSPGTPVLVAVRRQHWKLLQYEIHQRKTADLLPSAVIQKKRVQVAKQSSDQA